MFLRSLYFFKEFPCARRYAARDPVSAVADGKTANKKDDRQRRCVYLATLVGRNGEEGERRKQTERFLHGAKQPKERKGTRNRLEGRSRRPRRTKRGCSQVNLVKSKAAKEYPRRPLKYGFMAVSKH